MKGVYEHVLVQCCGGCGRGKEVKPTTWNEKNFLTLPPPRFDLGIVVAIYFRSRFPPKTTPRRTTSTEHSSCGSSTILRSSSMTEGLCIRNSGGGEYNGEWLVCSPTHVHKNVTDEFITQLDVQNQFIKFRFRLACFKFIICLCDHR